jgi:uncharacterized protein (DUF305 family)
MKKYIIASAAIVFAVAIQSCNADTKKETTTTMDGMEQKDTMKMDKMDDNKMEGMHDMSSMKMTGDFDLDFANTMVVHHQSAVEMAKEVIAKGSNAEVKTLAQNVVTAQEAEIVQFKNIIANYKMPEMKEGSKEAHNELAEVMEKMEKEMKGMTKTGNADKDFLMMMIPHHKSAVTMGEDELSHGKSLELKKMAQKIMNDQTAEIKQMESLLSKIK